MGAILDAAIEKYGDDLTVADPFSGGGTVTFEAARRGIKAYAQDLYPWPARGLASALQPCDQTVFSAAAKTVLSTLAPLRGAYQNSQGVELSHILRVRVARCLDCLTHLYEFPHPLVSLASRGVAEKHAWFGCYACGAVSKRSRGIANFACGACGARWSMSKPQTTCLHCASNRLVPTGWHAVLVQELVQDKHDRWKAVLRAPQEGDPIDASTASQGASALTELIAPGRETKRLLENGFLRWGDLYTQRQADVLTQALAMVTQLDAPDAIKDRLAFGVLGAAEMPAFLSRWDRFNLKPFEGMANHRYTQTTLAVEANLLSPVGRGTLPRRLDAAITTLQWLIESCSAPPKVVSTVPGRRGRKRTDWDILIATGSSANQSLRDGSISVVVTDPPYFEDVQYGELARLFHAWLRTYDPALTFDERQEAVLNPARGLAAEDYENTIAACLKESRRTLADGGALVLTFHNKNLAAWRALTGALYKAGFFVNALAVVRAENAGDHCKRNVKAMLHDLVLECVPVTSKEPAAAQLNFSPHTQDERNLAAMGLALADCVQAGSSEQLREIYERYLLRWTTAKGLIK
ncbi:hypothetical protein [Paraburkholderia aspalathi]|uniref:hypothetical protein n=1 Tax=Paraburkholderia aspalathi TaxID=1324617 RepID=UPI0038B96C47